MAKRKKFVKKAHFSKGRFVQATNPRDQRNPADVFAGIDTGKLGVSKAAQRTATKKEISDFQRTGISTAQKARLEATQKEIDRKKGLATNQSKKQQPLKGTAFDKTKPFGEIGGQSVQQQPQETSMFEHIVGRPIRDEEEFDESFRVPDPSGAVFDESGKQTNIPTVMDALNLGMTSTTSMGLGAFGIGSKLPAVSKGVRKISKDSLEALEEIKRWESFHAGGKQITDDALYQLEVLRARAGVVGENTALKAVGRWETFFSGERQGLATAKDLKHYDYLQKKALEIAEAQQKYASDQIQAATKIKETVSKYATRETNGQKIINTGGLSTPKVAESASGKVPPGYIRVSHRLVQTDGKLRVHNVYAAAREVSYLSKLTQFARKPSTIFYTIGSTLGLWGVGAWGKAEGVEGLSFEYEKATEYFGSDHPLTQEIKQDLDDATNEPFVQQVLSFIPILQAPVAAKRFLIKIEAARRKVQVTEKRSADIEAGNIVTPQEQAKRDEKSAFLLQQEEEKSARIKQAQDERDAQFNRNLKDRQGKPREAIDFRTRFDR